MTKGLRKDAAERYQVIGDMLSDLQTLKQELEFKSQLGRVASLDPGARTTVKLGVPRKRVIASSPGSTIAHQHFHLTENAYNPIAMRTRPGADVRLC